MKASSSHAPVRATVNRSLPASLPSVEVAGPGLALPWEHWLDRRPHLCDRSGLPAFEEYSVVSAAPAKSSPLADSLCNLLVHNAPLEVQPPRNETVGDVDAAVKLAIQTPDICLWSRGHGQDVSVQTAEVLRHAVRKGERVLLLATSPGPLERVLVKLTSDPTFLAIRFTAPGEKASNGPLTRFGLDEQRIAVRARLLARAEDARQQAERRQVRFAQEADRWQILFTLVGDIASIDDRRRQMNSRLQQLPDEVRRETEGLHGDERTIPSGPFAYDFAMLLRRHREAIDAADRVLFPLGDQRTALERTVADLVGEKSAVEKELAPYRAGRWWTLAYWHGRFASERRERLANLIQQEGEIQVRLQRVVTEMDAATMAKQAAIGQRECDVEAAIAVEVERRRGEIEQQASLVQQKRDQLAAEWDAAAAAFADRPAALTIEAHEQAHQRWKQSNVADHVSESAAHDAIAAFVKKMPQLAPVIAGTTLALVRHAEFAAAVETPFDLVIVDDADRLAEADLLGALAKAPRALVIGSAPSAASTFGKLWKALHAPHPCSAYQWTRGADGLRCRLRPIACSDERFVESERLADFPEIELRIYSPPQGTPRLDQVLFPATMSARDAKLFIYRELQEASVDRVDRPQQRRDDADCFAIAWECPESPTKETIELEPGLRETICVGETQLNTCRLEFDKSAGWTAAKIDGWLRAHLPSLDARRTADIQK